MVHVLHLVLIVAPIVGPAYIVLDGDVGQRVVWFGALFGFFPGGSVVGHFVVAEHIGVVPVLHGDTVPSFSFGGEVSTSGYFVPLVLIGSSILVLVIGHHDYARLAAASLGRIGSSVVGRVECIAIDTEVTQSGHIGYSVVKAYDHVSAPASQGDGIGFVPHQPLAGLAYHVFVGVSFLILGQHVDKLSGCRHIVKHGGNIGGQLSGPLFYVDKNMCLASFVLGGEDVASFAGGNERGDIGIGPGEAVQIGCCRGHFPGASSQRGAV